MKDMIRILDSRRIRDIVGSLEPDNSRKEVPSTQQSSSKRGNYKVNISSSKLFNAHCVFSNIALTLISDQIRDERTYLAQVSCRRSP
jgi:hypothetical protein